MSGRFFVVGNARRRKDGAKLPRGAGELSSVSYCIVPGTSWFDYARLRHSFARLGMASPMRAYASSPRLA